MTPIGQFAVTPGDSAELFCFISPSAGVIDVQWLVNGTLLMDIPSATVQYLGSGFGSLTFANLSSEFNRTRIGCRPVYSDGIREDSTDSTLLLLQGLNYISQTHHDKPLYRCFHSEY